MGAVFYLNCVSLAGAVAPFPRGISFLQKRWPWGPAWTSCCVRLCFGSSLDRPCGLRLGCASCLSISCVSCAGAAPDTKAAVGGGPSESPVSSLTHPGSLSTSHLPGRCRARESRGPRDGICAPGGGSRSEGRRVLRTESRGPWPQGALDSSCEDSGTVDSQRLLFHIETKRIHGFN